MKTCKSCGAEIKGEYCEKCGYGNPDLEIKSIKKPVNTKFKLSEDENVEYTKPDKKTLNRQFLVFLIIAIVAGLIYLLYSSGVFEKKTKDYEKVITNYFSAVSEADFDKYIASFPKELAQDYVKEKDDLGLSKKDYMKGLYNDYTEKYGEGYTLSVSFLGSSVIGKEDIQNFIDEYKGAFGVTLSIKQAFEIKVKVKAEGPLSGEEAEMFVAVMKIGKKWYVSGVYTD